MPALRDALRDLSEDVFFDLLESEDAYLLVLDVPGVSAESLDLAIEDGVISIDAHRDKEPTDDYRYLEENRSLFLEADLPLPDDASDAGAEATVNRGVLELTLPKRGAGEETTIDIVDEDAETG
ncbi:Hsp20/alpha crystallin family protein [Natrinema versiforme]|uniref:Heat shock protein Hsp20 n=1 Tax=Natrinema versiforme JCM 10478 TaxID=1227496 RepID=L9Y4E2_9EURY|nr:Hsp20/alpha crystallin family protein [Natrinema versiforme]ELY68511.1 heat shock protein Hsp20 [Natrinema versiforme JCM 10478]